MYGEFYADNLCFKDSDSDAQKETSGFHTSAVRNLFPFGYYLLINFKMRYVGDAFRRESSVGAKNKTSPPRSVGMVRAWLELLTG